MSGRSIFRRSANRKSRRREAQIDGLEKALDQYRLDVGRYPNTEQGLAALTKRPAGEKPLAGARTSRRRCRLDPWGAAYQYAQPGEHGDFDLFSFGKDGKAGGEDENADITNW